MKQEITALLARIRALCPDSTNTLPQHAFFLNDTDVVCCERECGESRHPYTADGLVIWACSSGRIYGCESTLHLFKSANSTEAPNINFFGGIRQDDGRFFPIALQNANRQLSEPTDITRYTVFTATHMYYLATTAQAIFAVRMHVSADKHIHFSFCAINQADCAQNVYLASCLEARLLTWEEENFWDRMRFYGEKSTHGYLLHADGHYMTVRQTITGGKATHVSRSAGRSSFLGKNGRGFVNAAPLMSGQLLWESDAVNTADMPVAADILQFCLQPGDCVRHELELSYGFDEAVAHRDLEIPIDIAAVDRALTQAMQEDRRARASMRIRFDDWHGALDPVLLNRFLGQVQKQVSFCALGKNYAGPLLGVRDVMQQLEVSLLWQPHESRGKLVTALHYILEDGRPPRQFSVPTDPDACPMMDLRPFIDQGVWILSTFYTYLCYTDDLSILDEPCSYYIASPDNTHIVGKSDRMDTVLEHLLRIADFLGSHLDPETGCLHALHGDWNDALDGLGKSTSPDAVYGNGVSVMASLQFYRNCLELEDILTHTGRFPALRGRYAAFADTLRKGLLAYAVDTDAHGSKRVIHGWGDNRRYRIGSFADPDGVARRSTTATAFWALSGMIDHTPALRETLIDDLRAVRSPYGLKTFDVPFARDTYPFVGRLATINPGTYENAAPYVHAGLFGVAALFCLEDSRTAWEEWERAAVISHADCTKTPFVMPNSYCDNAAYGMHGDSMGDWYTGSGAVLIKTLIRHGFGIVPTLDGLTVKPAACMPCDRAEVCLTIKGCSLTVRYENRREGERRVQIDGEDTADTAVFIPTSQLHDGMVITVTDGAPLQGIA